METTPLDGYKKISVTVLTTLLTVILFFVKDPVHATTLEQFWSGVLIPMVPAVIGLFYTAVQGGVDKEKARAVIATASTSTDPAGSSPLSEAKQAYVPQAQAPVVPAVEDYKPFDIDAALANAEAAVRKDGMEVTPLNRVYYFWPVITRFDLREVPRQLRLSESKRLVGKGIELFTEAFKYQTRLAKPPTPAQAAAIHTYMLQLKKDYEKANNLSCSDKTFEELRNMLTYFNDLYSALDGLNQLEGKTIDWSIYGSEFFGPTQVGWDFARFL